MICETEESRSANVKPIAAKFRGGTIPYESGGGKDNISCLTNLNNRVSSDFKVDGPGAFDVRGSYAHPAGGSECNANVGDQVPIGEVKKTGFWTDFITEKVGTIEISRLGKYTLTVKGVRIGGVAVMDLGS